jgi:methionine-rich copper-binding protein CopC
LTLNKEKGAIMKSVSAKIILAAAALALFGTSSMAFAHAHLESANPKKDAVLSTPPKQVTLHYSEALEKALCNVEVKDLKSGAVVSENKIQEVGDKHDTLRVELKPTIKSPGKFQVTWKVVSKDSHRMSGNYVFSIGSATSSKIK